MGKLVGRVSVGWYGLLNVEDQALGAQGPIAGSVLTDNFLRQAEGAVLGLFRLLLIGFRLIDFDQGRAAPCGVVQGFWGSGGLRMLAGILLVNVGFFFGALGRA